MKFKTIFAILLSLTASAAHGEVITTFDSSYGEQVAMTTGDAHDGAHSSPSIADINDSSTTVIVDSPTVFQGEGESRNLRSKPTADVLVNSKLVYHDGFDDHDHCDGTKETMITSKYTHFDDSVREWCMHALNIPRSNTDYKKISMRPCNDRSSNEKKRTWIIDSDALLRLSAYPSTCVKYRKTEYSASERVGLGICNPGDDASMINAVRVMYDPGTLRVSATVDGMGSRSNTFLFEVKHYRHIVTRKARRHRSEIRLSDKVSTDDPLQLWAFFCLPSDEVSTQDTLPSVLTCTPEV